MIHYPMLILLRLLWNGEAESPRRIRAFFRTGPALRRWGRRDRLPGAARPWWTYYWYYRRGQSVRGQSVCGQRQKAQ